MTQLEDPIFLSLFLPSLLALYFIVLAFAGPSARTAVWAPRMATCLLLTASVVFVAREATAGLLLGSAGFTLVMAELVDRQRAPRDRFGLLVVTIAVNLAIFASLRLLVPDQGFVSFGAAVLMCHEVGYVVDVYRRESGTTERLAAALYLLQFPMLPGGPIVRVWDFRTQYSRRMIGLGSSTYGARRFTIGFVKVAFLARTLGLPANEIFALPALDLSADAAWLATVCYSLQIYFQFSGYSDIGIGLGRILGFRYPENFRRPYTVDSVREFWRRWNITLMIWLRDYLHLPIVGRDDPAPRLYANIVLGFCLVGLWHGAGRGVLMWALYSSFWLALEAVGLGARIGRLPAFVRHFYLLAIVMVGWVILRADIAAGLLTFLKTMAGLKGLTPFTAQHYLTPARWLALGVGVIGAGPLMPTLSRWRVTLDAATTSLLMVSAATALFLWRGASLVVSSFWRPNRTRE